MKDYRGSSAIPVQEMLYVELLLSRPAKAGTLILIVPHPALTLPLPHRLPQHAKTAACWGPRLRGVARARTGLFSVAPGGAESRRFPTFMRRTHPKLNRHSSSVRIDSE